MVIFDFGSITNTVIPLIVQYGPISVFLLVLLEEIVIPIPSPVFPMAAGFLLVPASASIESAIITIIFTIAIPGALATAIGSLVIYAVSKYFGKAFFDRFRFFGISGNDVERMGKRLGKKTWPTIALLRAIPIFPTSVVTVAAGVMKLDAKKFFAATFIGAIPRMIILAFVGWQLGAGYAYFSERIGFVENVVLFAVVIGILAGVYYCLKKKANKKA